MTEITEFDGMNFSWDEAEKITADALSGADDGELFVEFSEIEALTWDSERLKSASFNKSQGFGLRAVAGETAGYAHSSDLSTDGLKRASEAVKAAVSGYSGTYDVAPQGTNKKLYSDINPLQEPAFAEKVALLEKMDTFARALDPRIRQFTASLATSWQAVEILRADGHRVRDIRPLVRVGFSVMTGEGDRQETGSYGYGGRSSLADFLDEETWRSGIEEALRVALVNMESVPAPAGEMSVVLGAGWPGIMLHEAVGHGLEGDFNRKGTSAFAGLMGEQVAAKGVTVLDDGTIEGRRGSVTVDDEGTPPEATVLIEDGILKGYMQDRQNARLMGVKPTGNGRRQSYSHIPMPRMTNTYMLGGDHEPGEIISSVSNGIYAVGFGGGQVDITSGKFVFSCTEAYKIENGKVGAPVKGAMLIGNGPDALHHVSMIGNDMKLDDGIGTCGKQGQGVPVGVGQPTLRIDNMTVGGTAV